MREILRITKALSDETRVRALLSVKDGELCLCQIIGVLGLGPSTVSKHMTILERAGLVRRRKQGKWHFYRIAGPRAGAGAKRALAWILAELRSDPTIARDIGKVRDVRRRELEDLSACYRA